MEYKLELIGFTLEGCQLAQALGANRIELCDNPVEGGTTPSYGFIKAARSLLNIELYPIIRPRGGDFLYNDAEFEIMKSDVQLCKKLGCDGIVIGLLHSEGTIDKEKTQVLVELAYPMGVTFHRAFDRVADPNKSLEDIIDLGCERILTSGLQATAAAGIQLIESLIKQADNRIIIMPGSGVRADNIIEIANKTGAKEFHSSARIFQQSKMNYLNPLLKEQLTAASVDVPEIKNMIAHLKSL